MKLVLNNLDHKIEVALALAELGKPLVKKTKGKREEDFDLFKNGFSSLRMSAEGCLGWIWCQWHLQTPGKKIRKEIEFAVERGMEAHKVVMSQRYRGLHDLWLLNCAILASSESQLQQLAKAVVDSKGHRSTPINNGELFAAAWSGALKYWILGDSKRAGKELAITDKAYRYYNIAKIAPKPLVQKWLTADWEGFRKEQKKDFQALWKFLRKHRLVASENATETVIDYGRLSVPGDGWCWSHCGLAMLAHRRGIEVVKDPFWFPPHALQCVEARNDKK